MKNVNVKKISLVIGSPISHSLSPLIHSVAYRSLGIDNEYFYTAVDVAPENVVAVVSAMRVLGIRSISCTLPHKELVLPYLDKIDEVAKEIGAVNTIVNEDGVLVGYNTDWLGVVEPVMRRINLNEKKVLVLGAGGAAKAAAYGFKKSGANVVVCNRTKSKAEALAQSVLGNVLQWEDRENEAGKFDLIFNATSIGFAEDNFSALSKESFSGGQIVFDAVYNPYETPFLKNAKLAGAKVIYGSEMFIEQAAQQILLYSGKEAPREIMENALLEALCQR